MIRFAFRQELYIHQVESRGRGQARSGGTGGEVGAEAGSGRVSRMRGVRMETDGDPGRKVLLDLEMDRHGE